MIALSFRAVGEGEDDLSLEELHSRTRSLVVLVALHSTDLGQLSQCDGL